jgi:hypothetical protein
MVFKIFRNFFSLSSVYIITKGVTRTTEGKMRTGNTLKIITFALLVIAFMSATAFAAVAQPSLTMDENVKVSYDEEKVE